MGTRIYPEQFMTVEDGRPLTQAEKAAFLDWYRQGTWTHKSQSWVPIVTTCERKRTYLPHCLHRIQELGIGPPVVSVDTVKHGPIQAFWNACRIAYQIYQATENYYLGFLMLQDDAWLVDELPKFLESLGASNYAMSLYRTVPPESVDRCQTFQHGPAYVIDSYHVREDERINGGVGFAMGQQFIRSCVEHLPGYGDMPVPQAVYNVSNTWSSGHYQMLNNLVEHMGAVSAIDSRPEEHRMPCPDWLMERVHELDRKFGLSYPELANA